MVSNKKARLTMSLSCDWDSHKPINRRVKNKVIVTLWGTYKPGSMRYSTITRK